MQEMRVRSLGQEDPLEKEMATHSSILAWRIPWTEDPGGLPPIGSPIPSLFFKKLHSFCFPSLKPAAFYKVELLWTCHGVWKPRLQRGATLSTICMKTSSAFQPNPLECDQVNMDTIDTEEKNYLAEISQSTELQKWITCCYKLPLG